jgi:hypothetical protein
MVGGDHSYQASRTAWQEMNVLSHNSNPLCEVFYAVSLLKDIALKSARI